MSELGPEDESLLRGARSGIDPTPDDHARIKRRLFAQLGIGAATGGSAIATSTGASAGTVAPAASFVAGSSAITKIVIGALFLGLASGGALVVKGSRAHSVTASTATATTTTATSTSNAEPTPTASSTLPVIAPLAASQAPLSLTPPVAPTPLRSHSSSDPSAASDRSGDPPWPAASNAAALPTETAASATNAINSVQPPSVAPSPAAGPTTVDAEAALLRSADTELKAGRADHALALLDRHATQFSNGVLTEEREAERVVVLCALGRKQEARDAAAAFLTTRPRSPQAARIRASCGGN